MSKSRTLDGVNAFLRLHGAGHNTARAVMGDPDTRKAVRGELPKRAFRRLRGRA